MGLLSHGRDCGSLPCQQNSAAGSLRSGGTLRTAASIASRRGCHACLKAERHLDGRLPCMLERRAGRHACHTHSPGAPSCLTRPTAAWTGNADAWPRSSRKG